GGRGGVGVDGGVLAIVLVSLAIGMPFTLQYARESVPHEFWTSPIFMTTNRRIPGVWAAAFAVMTAADAAGHAIEAIPLWVDIAASVVAFAVAVWFTRWYPTVVRRHVANGSARGAL